jgi:transposase
MVFSDFNLLKAYALRSIEVCQLHERLSSLEGEIARLKEMIKAQQDALFGKKSEASKSINPPQEGQEAGLSCDDTTGNKTHAGTTTVAAHTRKTRGSRTLDSKSLPKYTEIHDLSQEQKVCPCCGKSLHYIGQEKSEQLEIIPSRYCIIEHIRMKYGCRPCDSIVMAPKPPAPLPKAIAGPSLLTDVILNKYQYHLPLYRQSKIMKSYGLVVSDKTLSNWIMGSGEGLLKMHDALWVILKNRYLQVDETPVKVLETNKKGYIWAYFAPNVGKGLVAFEFSEDRRGSIAFERLKTFNGLLQTDGYSGYKALRDREGIVGFGCLSHARRKFSEVVKTSKSKDGIAQEMIDRMKPLYALEARMRDASLNHRTRKRLRQKSARPILKDIHAWLRAVKPRVLPKSKLGKAIQYTLNQWPYLIAYLKHGMAEIDTNYVENKIREIALGKKNWLFFGNKDCGKIHALFYSLIISAIINDLNPRVYIHYLLTKIHDLRRGALDPITLLPDRIDCNALEQFALGQIALGQKIMA